MWVWCSVLCVSLVCGLALDSNTIRSSKEAPPQSSEQLDRSHGDQTEMTSNSRRQPAPGCSAPKCDTPPRGGCSNRAQRRPSSADRQVDRQRDRETDRQRDGDGFNRTKAQEMSSCVRSGDCAAGLCCVRYLTGKRCQRIPVEGEACLLRGPTKLRRNLGRCDCDAGLSCTAAGRAEPGRAEPGRTKGQGVCLPRPRQGQRKTRHSGKKRRTAERSC
ncbi:dickkopf-related protein 4-like isoform X2 [Amphiprion ocellaris]|uniref:dickkopf-related protein 4-like isoform X2 n=1 Tax=Amphiprion ocellaris TaxID=80972 RepID=UPI0024117E46|nr:dickkopf-related protein 4-like isoform X2 [Amphiprion ocellaris]